VHWSGLDRALEWTGVDRELESTVDSSGSWTRLHHEQCTRMDRGLKWTGVNNGLD